MKKQWIQLFVFVGMVLLSFQAFENPYSTTFFDSIKQTAFPVNQTDDDLYQTIQNKAKEYYVPAKNAEIHRIWKKTPGIYGKKVNVEKSYNKMKKRHTYDEKLLEYDPIQPEVTLEQLPPAPIYRGHPDKQMVSFLINVSWGQDYIPMILNKLKEYNIKATFFIDGKWAKSHVDLVKMIDEQGHDIGSHAYNHPDMKELTQAEAREQIIQTNDILEAIIGKKPKWFAPPSGSFNDQTVRIADELGMETILWTVDTIDWRKPSTEVMIHRVMSKIHPGAMILMHPTQPIVMGMEELILKIDEKGYKIDTVSKLLSENR